MVLSPSDRRGGSGRIVVGGEKRAWNRLARKFYLVDSFVYKPGHLKYSWDSKRKFRHNPVVQLLPPIGDRVLKIIDRIHFSEFARQCPFTITSTILAGYFLSDHAHVLATIRTVDAHTRPSLYCLNTHHLKNEKLLEKLRGMW